MGVVCTMLFALPAVRETMPGNPIIGCTSDLIGFFWNMGLIAISAILLLWRFSFQDINKDKESRDKLLSGAPEASMQIQVDSGSPESGSALIQKSVAIINMHAREEIEMRSVQSVAMEDNGFDLGEAYVKMSGERDLVLNEDEIETRRLVQ